MTKTKSLSPGVSGLLRVKNEAKFLEACVESCIDALDELVIIYQPCTDNSPDIINNLQSKHPHKIITYFYNHEIKSHNLSEEEITYTINLPEGDKKLLATYYNTGLSLCSCKHIMKIDADQIYNTEKLRNICNAYRTEKKIKISLKERLAFGITTLSLKYNILRMKVSRRFSNKTISPSFTPGPKLAKLYTDFSLKMIQNKKWPIAFSGFNVVYEQDKACLSFGNYLNGYIPPFNGLYDTIIFPNSPIIKFVPAVSKTPHGKYGNCVIEELNFNYCLSKRLGMSYRLLRGGFLWLHLDLHKSTTPLPEDYPSIPINITYKDIEKCFLFAGIDIRFWHKFFFTPQVTNLTKGNWKEMIDCAKQII